MCEGASRLRSLRIAMVGACPFPTSQGSQVLVRQVTETLVELGHQVTILAYHVGEEATGLPARIMRTPRLPGYRKLGSGPAWGKLILDPMLAARLWHLARQDRLDVIHAHGYEGLVVALAVGRLVGVPVVYHGHGALEHELPTYVGAGWPSLVARRLGEGFDAWIPPLARHCIAVSPSLRDHLVSRGRVRPSRVTWLPPGAALEPASPELVASTVRRLGLDGSPVVLYTGNLDRYQRLDLLLAAMPTIFDRVPSARLVIATHGPDGLDLARGDPRVTVWPRVSFDEVRGLLGLATVAVVPRTCPYGFPVKLLNALCAGVPAVAFRHVVSFLATEPPALTLVDDVMPEALGAAVSELLTDPVRRQRLGESARLLVREYFDRRHLGATLERIYASIIPRAASRPGW